MKALDLERAWWCLLRRLVSLENRPREENGTVNVDRARTTSYTVLQAEVIQSRLWSWGKTEFSARTDVICYIVLKGHLSYSLDSGFREGQERRSGKSPLCWLILCVDLNGLKDV